MRNLKMRKIEFLKQGMKNFCNHIDPVEIDFTNGSITMITGANGIGKTSIFQAIPFTLYGQCEKGRGDDVLNNKTGKNCHTWTLLKIDDIKYRVDRYVKYTKLGNSVTITRGDDTKPYLKGHKEVLPEIEKLLMPYKLFINTLLFSQKVKTFFTDLTDGEQKEIFRKILTLDEYVLYQQQCGIELKNIELIILELNQIVAVNEGLLDSTTKQIELLNEKKEKFENDKQFKIRQLENEGKEIVLEILNHVNKQKDLPEDTNTKQQEITNKISVINHKLDNLDGENDTKIDAIDGQKSLKISELEKKSLELSNEGTELMGKELKVYRENFDLEKNKIQEQLDLISKELQRINIDSANYNSTMTFIEREIENLQLDSELTHCPTCKREINEECVNHLEKIKSDNEAEIIRVSKLRDELALEHNKYKIKETNWHQILQKEEDKFKESCQVLQLDNREVIGQYVERKNIAINKVEALMKDAIIKIKKYNNKERENLQLEISKLTIELNTLFELQVKIDVYNQTLQGLQHNKDINDEALKTISVDMFDDSLIKDCETKSQEYIKIINDTLDERSRHDEQIKMIQFWKKGFSSSGIQSMLIDEAIPFMNKRIGHYMEMLCGGRYTVTFDTLKATKNNKEFRDKISVEVFDNKTHSDKRVKFSGGQTRLVDIGTILTLSDLMSNIQDVSFNIILFDEIFDALDEDNIRFAANLLRETSKDKWIGVISHRHIDAIEADNVLSFR